MTSEVRSPKSEVRSPTSDATSGAWLLGSALAVALLVVTAPLAAQVYDRALTEQDVRRITPVLRADRAGLERLARQASERQALERVRGTARQQAVKDVAAGVDPLDWLTRLSSSAAAPSTARYEAACSRALTQSAADPTAVFSFGIAAPPAWLAVWKARDRDVPISDRSQATSQPGAQWPGATRPETLTQQARSFYSGRTFEYQGEPAPFEWQFLAPDRLVSATVMGVNVLGRVEACRALPSGPMVVLKAEGEAFGKAPRQPGSPVNRELAGALDKAGLSEAEYLNLKFQLMTAQADAKDPSRLNNPASLPEERRQEMEIRRQNAEFYRQHADELAPLLAELAR